MSPSLEIIAAVVHAAVPAGLASLHRRPERRAMRKAASAAPQR